jgi:DNA-binding response OmpR family regulator
MRQAIYLAGNSAVDAAVERGLLQANCRIYQSNGVSESLTLLEYQATDRRNTDSLVVLVTEIDAGGMLLLETMWQRGLRLPPTLLIDRDGQDIDRVRRAVRMGVAEYLLPKDADLQREYRARQFVEKVARRVQPRTIAPSAPAMRPSPTRRAPNPNAILDLRWDADLHTIFLGERDMLQLSPAEARTFEMLYVHRGRTVGIEELIEKTLVEDNARNPQREIQLLRTHLARLRRRLASHPGFGYRIENMRGAGYMML